MAHHAATSILILSIMAVWAVQGSALLDSVQQLTDESFVAVVVDADSTTEIFGHTYKQAVLLFKDRSNDPAALENVPDQAVELNFQLNELNAPEKESIEKLTVQVQKLRKSLELLAAQLNVKKLVNEYNRRKSWWDLKRSLEAVLDSDGPAYKQLHQVKWIETHAPWRIAYDGHAELASVLVLAGRGVNMTDDAGDGLLHGAAAGGRAGLVDMLLDNGADIESRNKLGDAPLALACKHRRLHVAQLLWRRGAHVDAANYDEKWAGLAHAAVNGDLDIVEFMVAAGASTVLKDKDGRTPLELARLNKHTSVVKYLSQFPQ